MSFLKQQLGGKLEGSVDDFDLDDDLPPEYAQVLSNVERTVAKTLRTKEIKVNDDSDDDGIGELPPEYSEIATQSFRALNNSPFSLASVKGFNEDVRKVENSATEKKSPKSFARDDSSIVTKQSSTGKITSSIIEEKKALSTKTRHNSNGIIPSSDINIQKKKKTKKPKPHHPSIVTTLFNDIIGRKEDSSNKKSSSDSSVNRNKSNSSSASSKDQSFDRRSFEYDRTSGFNANSFYDERQVDSSLKSSNKDLVVEAKGIPGKKKREEIKKVQGKSFAKKSSSFLMDVSSPNLVSNPKVGCDAYCTVQIKSYAKSTEEHSHASPFSEKKFRTRTIYGKLNPFWCEEFTVDIENPDATKMKIILWDNNKYEHDEPFGKLIIPIKHLFDQEAHENWYPIYPVFSTNAELSLQQVEGGMKNTNATNNTTNTTTESKETVTLGSIRLKLKYTEEVILPLTDYKEIIDELMDEKLTLVKLISKVTNEREAVAAILVKIFQACGDRALFLVKSLVSQEIDSTHIIFRGNSLATKAVDVYMKFIGMPYLHQVLAPWIKKLYLLKASCEINPTKIEKGADVKKNYKRLLKLCSKILNAILGSLAHCPPEFRQVFHHIQEKVKQKFDEEQVKITRYTAVSGFIFLRFFCPGVLGPKLFALAEEHPNVNTNRTLILIAKTLQNIANLVEFSGDKEEYMADMNPFVVGNFQKMKEFLDALSTPQPNDNSVSKTPPIKLEKELASIYRHLQKDSSKFEEVITSPEEKQRLQKIFNVLKRLQESEANEIQKLKLSNVK